MDTLSDRLRTLADKLEADYWGEIHGVLAELMTLIRSTVMDHGVFSKRVLRARRRAADAKRNAKRKGSP
jgi:hypothetical protein